MEFRYRRYDPRLEQLAKRIQRLTELFQHLLLLTDGDVERALEYLGQVAERYRLFDERLTLDQFRRHLEQQNVVERGSEGELELTAKGERGLRVQALESVFGGLGKDGTGEHRTRVPGIGTERTGLTRPYRFGDSRAQLDVPASLSNALRRGAVTQPHTAGNFDLREEDLEVFETEHLSSCATVLLVDVSHSMILYGEDRITPAKRVALALCELITTRYPKDSLDVVLFGDRAWRVPMGELPYISAGPYHTNTKEGLELARDLLRRSAQANKQIFMITDGKPSALTERNGEVYKNPFGLDRRVVNKTLEEALQCRRLGIPVTTFMLTEDPTLVEFVERFTEINHGRAYFASPDRLDRFLLVDYLRNRRGAR